MAFELIPFQEIKDLLELEKSSIDDYPPLKVINNRLLSSFEEHTGREFEKVERVEEIFVESTPSCMIPLKGLPVESVSSVLVTSDGTNLESFDYNITSYGIKLGSKVKNVRVAVTYTGGLSVVTNPIKAAALYQLAYEFQSKEQIGAQSFTTDGGSVSRPELGLLKETRRMLNSSLHPLKL